MVPATVIALAMLANEASARSQAAAEDVRGAAAVQRDSLGEAPEHFVRALSARFYSIVRSQFGVAESR